MPRLRLSDEDRERLGAPELLPFDHKTVTVAEAIELQKLGYPSVQAFTRSMFRDEGGPNYESWMTMVWLALRRVGVVVEHSSLMDLNVAALRVVDDEKPVEPKVTPGKGRTARAGSKNSPTPSSTSSATSKARSSRTSSRS